jgi:RNA polymerase sigma-70 factor (ECF subfamily)
MPYTNFHSTNLSIIPWTFPSSFRTAGRYGQVARVEPDRTSRPDVVGCVPDDEELTLLARNGDNEAFEELIQRHRGLFMKRALRMMRNLSAAEDAVQSACRSAFQHLGQFQGKGTFAAVASSNRGESVSDEAPRRETSTFCLFGRLD